MEVRTQARTNGHRGTNLFCLSFDRRVVQQFGERICKVVINQLEYHERDSSGRQTTTHSERINGQRDFFPKNELNENLVDGKIDDSRIQHRFGHILPDHSKNVGPFS